MLTKRQAPPPHPTVTPALRRACHAGAALIASVAILAAPAAARADEPAAPPPPLVIVVAPPPVPGPWAMVGRPVQKRSKALRAGGIATVVAGALVHLSGVAILVVGNLPPWNLGFCFDNCRQQPPSAWVNPVGAGLVAGGLAVIGGGVAMIVIGGQEAPPAVPAVAVGPRTTTLTWSF